MTDYEKVLRVIERVCQPKKPYTNEDLAEEIVKELRPSFSEAIIKNGEVIQKCSLGHVHRIYLLQWREEYLTALRELRKHGRLTTTKYGQMHNTPTHRKCLSELVHFGLVKIFGHRHGNALYSLTDDGYAFLEGKKPVNTRAWQKVPNLPEECKDHRPKYISQVIAEHPRNNRAAHAEMAVASVVN